MADLVINLKINETLSVPVQGTIQDAFNQLSEYDPFQAASIKETIDNGFDGNVTSNSLFASTAQDDPCCTATNYFCDISAVADCGDIAYVFPTDDGPAYHESH